MIDVHEGFSALLAARMLEAHERRCEHCQRGPLNHCFSHFAIETRLKNAIEREAASLSPSLYARERRPEV